MLRRAAFTMLELILVIIVLGILASMALPRLERDSRQEAGDSILAAIRYTQHLALSDNVIDPNEPKWQRKFWRFGVRECTNDDIFYYVGSDLNLGGNIDSNEAAIDPANGGRMWASAGTACPDGRSSGSSPNIFLSHKFGIKNTNMFNGCSGTNASAPKYIGFDHLGRPHSGFHDSDRPDYSSLLTSDCDLTFEFIDTDIPDLVIRIEKETGYAYIVGQDKS